MNFLKKNELLFDNIYYQNLLRKMEAPKSYYDSIVLVKGEEAVDISPELVDTLNVEALRRLLKRYINLRVNMKKAVEKVTSDMNSLKIPEHIKTKYENVETTTSDDTISFCGNIRFSPSRLSNVGTYVLRILKYRIYEFPKLIESKSDAEVATELDYMWRDNAILSTCQYLLPKTRENIDSMFADINNLIENHIKTAPEVSSNDSDDNVYTRVMNNVKNVTKITSIIRSGIEKVIRYTFEEYKWDMWRGTDSTEQKALLLELYNLEDNFNQEVYSAFFEKLEARLNNHIIKRKEIEKKENLLSSLRKQLESPTDSVNFNNAVRQLLDEGEKVMFKHNTQDWAYACLDQDNLKRLFMMRNNEKQNDEDSDSTHNNEDVNGDSSDAESQNSDEMPYEPMQIWSKNICTPVMARYIVNNLDEKNSVYQKMFNELPSMDFYKKCNPAGKPKTDAWIDYLDDEKFDFPAKLKEYTESMSVGGQNKMYPSTLVVFKYGTILELHANGMISYDCRYMPKIYAGDAGIIPFAWNTDKNSKDYGRIYLPDFFKSDYNTYKNWTYKPYVESMIIPSDSDNLETSEFAPCYMWFSNTDGHYILLVDVKSYLDANAE